MDPIDKLELIVNGTLKKRKHDYEGGKDKHSNLYLLGLQSSIDTLELVRSEIAAIRRNSPDVSDEIVMMYGV